MSEKTGRKAGDEPVSPEGETGSAENDRRYWGAKAKAEVVMRLLKGESLDALSRECRRPASDLSAWREDFIHAGVCGLMSRKVDPVEARLKEAQAKVGDLSMRLELAEIYLKKKGVQL